MSSLLPPNATDTEHAIEATTERTTDLPVPLRTLWNPDTCPADLLPWLAWALSIDSWKDYWPEAVKRQRIRQAIEIQRRKGTAQSVRDVVESFGGGLAMREWWQKEPVSTPHTFELVLTLGGSVPATAEYQEDIISEVSRTKPVRSHFTFTAGLSATGGLGLGGIIRTAAFARLRLTEKPFQGGMGLQGAARPVTYTRLTLQEA
jgi:phage tail P2-like protein